MCEGTRTAQGTSVVLDSLTATEGERWNFIRPAALAEDGAFHVGGRELAPGADQLTGGGDDRLSHVEAAAVAFAVAGDDGGAAPDRAASSISPMLLSMVASASSHTGSACTTAALNAPARTTSRCATYTGCSKPKTPRTMLAGTQPGIPSALRTLSAGARFGTQMKLSTIVGCPFPAMGTSRGAHMGLPALPMW
jgi:hypothetical protein